MTKLKDIFLNLEKKIGTEGAFNILMVEYGARKSFFEALRFSTMRKLNNYMKKYRNLLVDFKNIDVYVFEIHENKQFNEIMIRFMVFHKKYEKKVKKIKTYTDHKLIGYMLDYSCPKDLGDKPIVSYILSLIKDEKLIYVHNWIDPNKVNILKQKKQFLFSYGCPTDRPKDYNNIKRIGNKCMDLIKTLGLPYKIEITQTFE